MRPSGLSTFKTGVFWIKDKSLTDTDSLVAPDIIAAEISEALEAALEQFKKIAARLS